MFHYYSRICLVLLHRDTRLESGSPFFIENFSVSSMAVPFDVGLALPRSLEGQGGWQSSALGWGL